MRRAVFLDRDGVLNRAFVRDGVTYPPASVADLELLPGVVQAVHLLAQHQLRRIVVTNQPDVARGSLTRAAVEQINQQLTAQLSLDGIWTCFHDNADDCACRKPRPGLLLAAAQHHAIDLKHSFMVGDRWSDIVAGQAAGCYSVLVVTPYSQQARCTPQATVANVLEAAHHIIEHIQDGKEPQNDAIT
jgi:D-glycero-D-manno-heptose 1,7-bisphosphate phosphatase